MMEQIISALKNTQNIDGGWGVSIGRKSQTEATTFAILGLSGVMGADDPTVARGVQWLAANQRPDGSWPLYPDMAEPSWATALAVLALSNIEAHQRNAVRGATWLVGQKGAGLGFLNSVLFLLARHRNRLNPDVKGWSWTPNTFSWVEPTSYASLALKKLRRHLPPEAAGRIGEADLFLYDRMCDGGGWNYGNSEVLGSKLWPYPDTTAVALIALQDHRAEAANRLSLAALRQMLEQTKSGLALGWSMLCFSLYGEDVSPLRTNLENAHASTGSLWETKILGLALVGADGNSKAFRV